MAIERTDELVVPVIDERVEVERSVVDTAEVHVRRRVTERVEHVRPILEREEVTVERVEVNRFVDEAVEAVPEQRMEGDVLVVPVLEEIAVVQRRLLLREELRIRKRRVPVESEPQDVLLRRQEVEIERVPLEGGSRADDEEEEGARR